MNILAIDTSGPSLGVALLQDGRLAFECIQQNGLTHSDSLMPLVDTALTAGRLGPSMVDCYAVTTGPGSFTGVRIGVETVKALAHATDRPCLGINALEAIACTARLFDGTVCPLRDARAGQVYGAAYRQGVQILPDTAEKIDLFLASVHPMGRCCFLGDGAAANEAAIRRALGENAVIPPATDMPLRAANVALLAQERQAQWHGWQTLMPYYLRAPQAERERLARQAHE